ncbi:MAG: prepilin-type N-terminal cleavage/methylation domain-containing protein [Candidatus Staskawiczbacteria bacterium]|nr:prepilin-type N-terminal cleavage/methylation domain-containing protein [Candidatus Staskawiczbacteria bacterium]
MKKGFTLMELIVVVAIIVILSSVILFSASQYLNKGKDSNIFGNLATLIAAGEVWYNGYGSYDGFCDPTGSGVSVVKNALSQMPIAKNPDPVTNPCYSAVNTSTANPRGVCCGVGTVITNNDAWAACAQEFADSNSAFCVDSRGVKKGITVLQCKNRPIQCPE